MAASVRIARHACVFATGATLLGVSLGVARADPPAGTGGAQVSDVKGGFLSSLKQAFEENPERDVVLGHFDVGTPPDTHRFYCLVDPKTGKKEANAVGGEPARQRDGTTRIQRPAVSPLSCADAEQKGLLITAGYAQGSGAGTSTSAAGAPAAVPPAAAAVARAASNAQGAAPVAVDALQREVTAAFTRFIAGQNAHDRGPVAAALLDSKDFVWVGSGGDPVWGYTDALAAFAHEWQGTWKLDPQGAELRIASPAPGVAVLITPLLITAGDRGRYPSTLPVRWEGVFVKTGSGWRISAIFTTPLPSRQAPNGG